MMTVSQFADAIGRKRIAEALNVAPTAVSNAVARKQRFPASWFDPLSRLAKQAGVDCPREMFSWRELHDTRKVDAEKPSFPDMPNRAGSGSDERAVS